MHDLYVFLASCAFFLPFVWACARQSYNTGYDCGEADGIAIGWEQCEDCAYDRTMSAFVQQHDKSAETPVDLYDGIPVPNV